MLTRRNKTNQKKVPKVFVCNGMLVQMGKVNIMKNLKNYLLLIATTILTGLTLVSCSQDDGIVEGNKIKSTVVEKGLTSRVGGCYIDGATVIGASTTNAAATVNAGTTATFEYKGNFTAKSIKWVVASGNGISFISTTGNTVVVAFSTAFKGGSIKAIGTDASNQDCNPVLPISLADGGNVPCSATINQINCSPGTMGYNTMISVDVNLANPFPNTASVLVQWDPEQFTGFQNAGGLYTMGPYEIRTKTAPSQFSINASNNAPSGFYVPMIVKYTDLTTGQTCTVKLNPLVTGGCNDAPF